MPIFEIDPEIMVKAAIPKAHLVGGLHGKVWIDDGDGRILGEIQANGTREIRIKAAWITAFGELCKHFKAQAKFFGKKRK